MGSLFPNRKYKPARARYGRNIHRAPDQIEKFKERERSRSDVSEDSLQLNVAKHLRQFYPGVFFHSDTGSGGLKSKAAARRGRAMNYARGWPDMQIPVPRRGFSGLFIELKKDGVQLKRTEAPREILKGDKTLRQPGDWWDRHTEEQHACHKYLRSNGFYVDFAVGEAAALRLIDWYFGRVDDGQPF